MFLLCVSFLSGWKLSPAARLMPLQWQRNCQKMCFPLGGYLPQSLVTKTPISLDKSYKPQWKALQISWNYHRLYYPQLSGKVERTNGKTRLSRTSHNYMGLNELMRMVIFFMSLCLKHFWFFNFYPPDIRKPFLLNYDLQQFGKLHLCEHNGNIYFFIST